MVKARHNILVIAPHPDDETIGCGGTICRHALQGDRVHVVYLTSGELGLKRLSRETAWKIREAEAVQACRLLKCAPPRFLRFADWGVEDDRRQVGARMREAIREVGPDTIYLPHPGDEHPDHRCVWSILKRQLRGTDVECRAYEVWSPLPVFDHVEDVTPVWPRKMRALRAHASQMESFDYVRAVRGLAAYRGALAAHCRYAEVFQTLNT